MDQLIDLGVFTAKAAIIVFAMVVLIGAVAFFASRPRTPRRSRLEVEKLNARYRSYVRALQSQLLDRKELKALEKSDRKEAKKEKSGSTSNERRKSVFVLDFEGDLRGSAVDDLREEITAVLGVARPCDEVVLRLESPGGTVVGYGLAAAQLRRVKDHGVPLTVCVDKVAASGGYMMACVADRILAAPFAIVGSVGVIAAFANFHRILSKNDVEYREITAGEFKRTVSTFGEVTPAGLEKFRSQIDETHVLFKTFVKENRPKLDVDAIATGEYWYGRQALHLQLIDQITTSDAYLAGQSESADLVRVRYRLRKSWNERMGLVLSAAFDASITRLSKDVWLSRFGI